jgi:hypothetical protein
MIGCCFIYILDFGRCLDIYSSKPPSIQTEVFELGAHLTYLLNLLSDLFLRTPHPDAQVKGLEEHIELSH